MFEYWKRPGVGDERDVERLGDLRRQPDAELGEDVAQRPRPSTTRPATTRLTSPKRVLSWWWSMLSDERRAVEQRRALADPVLVRAVDGDEHAFARDRRALAAQPRRARMKPYSPGSGASPQSNITSPCRARRARGAVASSEPSASPSGFSCVVTSEARRASGSRPRPPLRSVVVCVSVSGASSSISLRHAHAALDRRIVFERQIGVRFSLQLAARAAPGGRRARPRARERRCALLLAAEDADADPRLAQVGRRSTPVTVTNPMRGSLSSGSPRRAPAGPTRSRAACAAQLIERPTTCRSTAASSHSWPRSYARPRRAAARPRGAPRDAGERQPRALPEVVVVDLGDGGAEAVAAGCAFADRTNLPLPLERAASGKCSSTERMPT